MARTGIPGHVEPKTGGKKRTPRAVFCVFGIGNKIPGSFFLTLAIQYYVYVVATSLA